MEGRTMVVVNTQEHKVAHRYAQAAAVVLLAWLPLFVGCAAPPDVPALPALPADADVRAIEQLLARQDGAWNRGDLHEFVAGYAESDRMTYLGKSGQVIRGRAALEERYRKSYPEGRRGELSFSDLDIRRLGPDAYLVLGRWALALPPDNPHGVFTLVIERSRHGLEIIHDHSSGAE